MCKVSQAIRYPRVSNRGAITVDEHLPLPGAWS
jgi:hypothetical protein